MSCDKCSNGYIYSSNGDERPCPDCSNKMTPEKVAALDQAAATLVDYYPTLWWNLFKNLKGKGFTEEQAMIILLKYVYASVRPTK